MESIVKSVFIKSPAPPNQVGFDVGSIFDHSATKGDIGIEIEVEGNKFPKHAFEGKAPVDPEYIPKVWKYHKDGSLRGLDNAEYVFAKPLTFDEVPDSISSLWSMFESYGTKLDVSNRTSIHVHLNVQRWHLNRLCTFMAMYFSLEEILTQWCGEHRVGNLFCLRAKDAPGIITALKKFLKTGDTNHITEGLHYAGFNAHALTKFGSIEIRTLRGCQDPTVILQWVQILRALYETSAEFHDPRELMQDFSGNGTDYYFKRLLGESAEIVRNGVSMNSSEFDASIYDGIHIAQDLTYCRDWSLYKPLDATKNPFGRLDKPAAVKPKKLGDTVALDMETYNNSFGATPVTPDLNNFSTYVSYNPSDQPLAADPPTDVWGWEPPVKKPKKMTIHDCPYDEGSEAWFEWMHTYGFINEDSNEMESF